MLLRNHGQGTSPTTSSTRWMVIIVAFLFASLIAISVGRLWIGPSVGGGMLMKPSQLISGLWKTNIKHPAVGTGSLPSSTSASLQDVVVSNNHRYDDDDGILARETEKTLNGFDGVEADGLEDSSSNGEDDLNTMLDHPQEDDDDRQEVHVADDLDAIADDHADGALNQQGDDADLNDHAEDDDDDVVEDDDSFIFDEDDDNDSKEDNLSDLFVDEEEDPLWEPANASSSDHLPPESTSSHPQQQQMSKECLLKSRRNDLPGTRGGPPVQYVHVPKAGGTSIQAGTVRWVRQSGGTASLLKFDGKDIRGSSLACPPRATTATVLTGHRGFGYCAEVERQRSKGGGLFTFTALRDPVARMVSWYDYMLFDLHERRASMYFGDSFDGDLNKIVQHYYDTKDVVEEGEKLLRYAGQEQARFLCGYKCMGPMAKGNKNYTEAYILARAMENLRKLDAIGIVERLDDMITQLRFHLPHLIPRSFKGFPQVNSAVGRARRKTVVDDATRKILAEWGWVDATLYEEARRLYDEKQRIAESCLLTGEMPPM